MTRTTKLFMWCCLFTVLTFVTGCKGAIKTKHLNETDSTIVKPLMDKNVSLISLIANPEKYNQQIIRVKGFLNLEFEGNSIYLHKEDYQLAIGKNGLWIDLDGAQVDSSQFKTCNKQYVILEGTFDMDNRGHMNGYSGTIKKITRIDLLNH